MKAYGGSRGIVPLIRNFGSSWKWLVSFMPLPRQFRRKSCQCASGRRLGGPQSLYERFGGQTGVLLVPNGPVRTKHLC